MGIGPFRVLVPIDINRCGRYTGSEEEGIISSFVAVFGYVRSDWAQIIAVSNE
jgi:hypothetical protein